MFGPLADTAIVALFSANQALNKFDLAVGETG